MLSDGHVYVITAATQTAPSVWQLNASATSTPVSIGSVAPTVGNPRCVMDGKVFWAAPNSSQTSIPTLIQSCSVSNCAATTATLLTSPGGAEPPVCDTTTDELVWVDVTSAYAGSTDSLVTVYRATTDGKSMRTLTSFYELAGADAYNGIGFVNGRSDRYFFTRRTFTPSQISLFYVGTDATGVSPVQIATGTPGQNGLNPGSASWANDALFVWDDDYGSQIMYDLPLPDGVTGAAATFYQGRVSQGIMDDESLYGAFSTLPGDAIGVCLLSNCANPALLFRGQQYAGTFTQDSTAIYWSTPAAAGNGFTVWKGAK